MGSFSSLEGGRKKKKRGDRRTINFDQKLLLLLPPAGFRPSPLPPNEPQAAVLLYHYDGFTRSAIAGEMVCLHSRHDAPPPPPPKQKVRPRPARRPTPRLSLTTLKNRKSLTPPPSWRTYWGGGGV